MSFFMGPSNGDVLIFGFALNPQKRAPSKIVTPNWLWHRLLFVWIAQLGG